MVDREARARLAELLRHLASGQISVGEFRERAPAESSDRGVQSVLGRVEDDYTELRCECLEAPLEPGSRYHGEFALPREERIQIARLILFLQSGQDYRYAIRHFVQGAISTCLPVMMFLLIPTALLIVANSLFPCTFRTLTLAAGWLWVSSLCAAAAFSMVSALVVFVAGLFAREDVRHWPFHNGRDYEEALKHPKLLCGAPRPEV